MVHDPSGMDDPELPITITSHPDGDAWTFETLDELVSSLVSFDSEDPAQPASVTDARGRPTRLAISAGAITAFALIPGWPVVVE